MSTLLKTGKIKQDKQMYREASLAVTAKESESKVNKIESRHFLLEKSILTAFSLYKKLPTNTSLNHDSSFLPRELKNLMKR